MARADGAKRLLARRPAEWAADLSGLFVQGVLVPLAQTVLLYGALLKLAPSWRGALALGPVAAFVLNFVAVDFLYYWNHRLLHGALWPWHALHHTPGDMDVFMSSRNTLWTPALIVYVWLNALFAFLLRHPAGYVAGAALTASLDLWRHSGAWPDGRRLPLLLTPREHAWHHSEARFDRNFGANLRLWDRLHGTHFDPGVGPDRLGLPLEGGLWRAVLLPTA